MSPASSDLPGLREAAATVLMRAIGRVETTAQAVPRHWSVSDVEGTLVLDPDYAHGLRDIRAGERIVVLFYFHHSQAFLSRHLVQTPPHRPEARGVFSTCSPVRPNPIGLSVLEVLGVDGCRVRVRGLDMVDGTPILDIKPHVQGRGDGSGGA